MNAKLAAALIGAILWLAPSGAGAQEELPDSLQDIAIVERPGADVPRDVRLSDHLGNEVTVGDYLADGKPLVLALVYYRCPMLCSLVLNGMSDGLREIAWTAGREYRVLVVSIDPLETPSLAREKRENYLREYGRLVPERGFDFAVGTEAEVRRLADAVGFRYRWDEPSKQYVHAAGLFVVTPDGRLSRTLYGIHFPRADLRLALVEASAGKLGNAWDRVVLFCYHYDPSSRGYVLAANRLMRLAGGASVVVLGVLLAGLWRREKRPAPPEKAS